MKLSTLLLTLCFPLASFAQTPLTSPKPYQKGKENNNPISPWTFCADPTSVEYNGRVYVYGTNDQQEWEANGSDFSKGNSYGAINSLVCMSSADLVNWTIHPNVEVKKVATWTGCSWAPSICSREEADGETHFYLYFANGASGIGVLTSTSPTGPWTDPLGKAMIPWGMKGMGDITWLFDPGVVVDENGTGWIAWGGGGGVHANNAAKGANEMLDMNTRIAKLNPDMLTIEPENITILPAPYHFEASELNIIDGKFYYTYSSDFSGDRSRWSSYTNYNKSKAKPAAPGGGEMCYMTSTDPLNANSWVYEGVCAKNPAAFGMSGGNNHTHLQKFNNSYYLFYHTSLTEGEIRKSYSGTEGGYRNIMINKATVEPEKNNITVTMTRTGVTQIKANRPIITDLQEAEMVWNYAGATYARIQGKGGIFTNVMRFTKSGSWTANRQTYANEEVKSFKARLRGKGKMEIRLDDINSAPIATIEFNSTSLTEYPVTLSTPFSGLHNIYFVFTEVASTGNNDFDHWQFFTEDITAISSATDSDATVKEEYFNLSGVKCNEKPADGICIVKRTLANGKQVTEKVAANNQ